MTLAEFCPDLDINSDFVAFIYLFALVYFGIWDVIKVNRKMASCRSDKRVVTMAWMCCMCVLGFN